MIEGLQVGRAVAAIMVVLFHANIFILPEKILSGVIAGRIFNMGYAGVEFFFVLSGFIMAFVHRADLSRPKQFRSYIRKRLVRIYPVYWMVFVPLVAVYFLLPDKGPEHARDLGAILSSLLLVPTDATPIMRVAWTLEHEMFFYILFAVLILNARIGLVLFVVWMGGCFWALQQGSLSYPLDFLLSPYNLLFLLGIITAYAYSGLKGQFRLIALLFGAALFFAVGISEAVWAVDWHKGLRTLSYGLGAALAVAGLAAGAIRPPGWAVFLGDASYSIYLVHVPVMSFCAILLGPANLFATVPPILVLIIFTGLGVGAGCGFHVLVENPVLAFFRRGQSKPLTSC